MLIEKTIAEFVEDTSSKNPVPGGGSVSALAGSIGGALTTMVGNLTIGKKAFENLDDSTKEKIKEYMTVLEELIKELNTLVDEDAEAFDKVMKAYKMPKNTEEERKDRDNAIEEGTKIALEVPFRTCKKCLAVLQTQEIFLKYGNKNAVTDVAVGALMAYSGLEGAILNVKINLQGLNDDKYKANIMKQCKEMMNEGKKIKSYILSNVHNQFKNWLNLKGEID